MNVLYTYLYIQFLYLYDSTSSCYFILFHTLIVGIRLFGRGRPVFKRGGNVTDCGFVGCLHF